MLRFWKVGASGDEARLGGRERVKKCVRREGRRVGRMRNQKWERVVRRAPLWGMPFFRAWAKSGLVIRDGSERRVNILHHRR